MLLNCSLGDKQEAQVGGERKESLRRAKGRRETHQLFKKSLKFLFVCEAEEDMAVAAALYNKVSAIKFCRQALGKRENFDETC